MKTTKFLLFLFGILLFVWSCTKPPSGSGTTPVNTLASTYSHELVSEWNETFCGIERYAFNYRPTPTPRALAYIGLATYEACINGMPDYKSLSTSFSGLSIPKTDATSKYHWPSVYNTCYATLMRKFFPKEMLKQVDANAPSMVLQAINAWEKISVTEQYFNNEFENEIESSTYIRSKAYGEAVANAVFEWAKSDNGQDVYLNPTNGWQQSNAFGAWKPTFPGPSAGIFPNWGKVRTFANTETSCTPPIPFSEDKTSLFYAKAQEIYNLSKNLTSEDKWVAQFWSDDITFLTFSPPSRWIAIADQVYKETNCTMEKAIVTSAKIGLALHDAAVLTWKYKYDYNVERPESYIKRLIDPNFEPILNNPITGQTGITPSFPAYPSGHATFGSAAGTVLKEAFGNAYSMSDRCHDGRAEFNGKARQFNNFDEMVEENALSRLYLGVHWRMDSDEGIRFGRLIGQKVLELHWQ